MNTCWRCKGEKYVLEKVGVGTNLMKVPCPICQLQICWSPSPSTKIACASND